MLPRGAGQSTPEEAAEALEKLKQMLNDEDRLYELAEAEHYRWNAFQRSEGYRGATLEQAETYAAQTKGSHIYRRAKLHAAICDWEALPQIAERFDKKMIEYDMAMIRRIPDIIGGADFIVKRI